MARFWHLFNVHLGTSFIERRHQARQLLSERVLNRRECRGPRIIVGDFNEWTRGLASRLMGEVFEAVDPRTFAPTRVPTPVLSPCSSRSFLLRPPLVIAKLPHLPWPHGTHRIRPPPDDRRI